MQLPKVIFPILFVVGLGLGQMIAHSGESQDAAAPAHHSPPAAVPAPPAPPAPARVLTSEPPDPDLKPLAKAVITVGGGEPVPAAWPLGVPLELSAARSVAGDMPQSLRWEITPQWVDQYSVRSPDNRRITVAGGTKAKTIKVTLYAVKNDTLDVVSVTTAIRPDPTEPGSDEPRPPPGPGPGPGPAPTPPQPAPPLSAMATQVRDLAIQHIPAFAARRERMWALALSHETIADQVTQGAAGVPAYAHLKEPAAIVEATIASNTVAAGPDRPMFVPFFTALDEVLRPLSKTTLSTAGGHVAVWKDIAAGLRAAAP